MRIAPISLLLALMIATPILAHGNMKHVIGTLESITNNSVVVKTMDGKTVEVKLASTTMFVDKNGKAAKLADLAPGERVVIHAIPKGSELVAHEVRFAPPTSAPASTTAHDN